MDSSDIFDTASQEGEEEYEEELSAAEVVLRSNWPLSIIPSYAVHFDALGFLSLQCLLDLMS